MREIYSPEKEKRYGVLGIKVKINVDNSKFLTSYFNIKSIPTLVLLKDGQFIHRLTGFKPKNIIKDLISKGKI